MLKLNLDSLEEHNGYYGHLRVFNEKSGAGDGEVGCDD